MTAEATPEWSEVWATSHRVNEPRYEWPDWYVEILRAFGVSEDDIRAMPAPTKQFTFAETCAASWEAERKERAAC